MWRGLQRLFRCIRWADVLILQGAPILGVAFSVGPITPANLTALILFCAASLLLVSHIFAFNDWAELLESISEPDSVAPRPKRADVSSSVLLFFSLFALVVGLVLFLFLSMRLFSLAALIAALGVFYSHPSLNAKSMPIVSTLLHLMGGTLYFLLGYALFSAIDLRGLLVGTFFGVTFAAGHPIQEVRDFEEDRQLGATTNAIVFGLRPNFFAGVVLFTIQYVYLFILAWSGIVPRFLTVLPVVFFPIHIGWTILTLRQGLSRESITRFQNRYRILYALIGLAMLVSVFNRH
jgi:4-hydroxybenzoate polyprenyltransferase